MKNKELDVTEILGDIDDLPEELQERIKDFILRLSESQKLPEK
jgi:hypothetical protein